MISRSSGAGPNGYLDLHVSLIRFISPSSWADVTTQCVEARGVTGVDFRQAHDPYWSPSSPQGPVALHRAITSCALEYPETSLRSQLRTDAQWRYQYAYLRGPFLNCLRSNRAGMRALPGLATYLSLAHNFDEPNPYSEVVVPKFGISLSSLAQKCPGTAPGLPQ